LKDLFQNYCSLSHHPPLKLAKPSDPGEGYKIRWLSSNWNRYEKDGKNPDVGSGFF